MWHVALAEKEPKQKQSRVALVSLGANIMKDILKNNIYVRTLGSDRLISSPTNMQNTLKLKPCYFIVHIEVTKSDQ